MPLAGQAHRLALRHPDQGQLLAARDQEAGVSGAAHFEAHPKSDPLQAMQDPVNLQLVPQHGRLAIVDLRPHHDGKLLALRHVSQAHAHPAG